MNKLMDVTIDKEGNELDLNEWLNEQGSRTMYTRLDEVRFCKTHSFDRSCHCKKCPFVFTGFRAHLHVQKKDGIYDRKTDKKLA